MNTTTATKPVNMIYIKKTGTVVENITPSKAKELLETNVSNRSLRQTKVEQYAKDMKIGKWMHNGESIKISKTGKLLDGQHRLEACVLAGVAFKTDVSYGLDDGVFTTIDTGFIRQPSDALHVAGFDNSSKIAAIIRFIINFKKGKYDQAARRYSKGKDAITNDTVYEFAKKHKESLYESYPHGINKDNNVFSGTALSALHYIFKSLSINDADDFCKKLSDGVGISKDSPIYFLRKKFIEDSKAKRKMDLREKVALVCKAWNFYRKNRNKITRLSIDLSRESFPKPI